MNTQMFTTTLELESCCVCHMTFAVPIDFKRQRRNDHGWFYCPAGHQQYYFVQSELDKQKAATAAAEREAQRQRERAEGLARRAVTLEHSRRVTKGHLTRIKRRVAAGVCPCCQRTFKNLANHMKGQHPDFGGGEGEG